MRKLVQKNLPLLIYHSFAVHVLSQVSCRVLYIKMNGPKSPSDRQMWEHRSSAGMTVMGKECGDSAVLREWAVWFSWLCYAIHYWPHTFFFLLLVPFFFSFSSSFYLFEIYLFLNGQLQVYVFRVCDMTYWRTRYTQTSGKKLLWITYMYVAPTYLFWCRTFRNIISVSRYSRCVVYFLKTPPDWNFVPLLANIFSQNPPLSHFQH